MEQVSLFQSAPGETSDSLLTSCLSLCVRNAPSFRFSLANTTISTYHVHSNDPKINPHKDRVREQAEARLKKQKEAKMKVKAAKATKKSAPAHNPSSAQSDKEHMDKQKQAQAQAKIKRHEEKVRRGKTTCESARRVPPFHTLRISLLDSGKEGGCEGKARR